MVVLLNQLIGALREELQHYGEMLALLDQQQDFVLHRATENLLDSVSAVEAQGARIQQARAHREGCQSAMAKHVGCPDGAPFAEMIGRVPEDYRPLLKALVEENNELLVRVQQRARQNHLLLTRSVEMMQRLLSSFFATPTSAVYTGEGIVPSRAPLQTLYEAVG